MLELVDLDETTQFRTQLQDDSGPVVLINTFTVPEGTVEQAVAAWKIDAEYFRSRPGYISTQLHAGIAGSRVLVNVAVWETGAHLGRAISDPAFAKAMENYPDGTVSRPHLFRKLAVPGLCVD
ncbi:antibiotic biosynthesis monooxygenase family protein [Streptomyces sp. NPDC047023]|uniref:antibiotic biosynthesis monooxygenase family protein n=1 Tax=Streptomyces sp. NPDC047023 TaxID=3155139 RepID=UPI0033CCAE60